MNNEKITSLASDFVSFSTKLFLEKECDEQFLNFVIDMVKAKDGSSPEGTFVVSGYTMTITAGHGEWEYTVMWSLESAHAGAKAQIVIFFCGLDGIEKLFEGAVSGSPEDEQLTFVHTDMLRWIEQVIRRKRESLDTQSHGANTRLRPIPSNNRE